MSLPAWSGYPHSTTVLRTNGLERVLDYDPVNMPVPDLTYISEFITPDCPGIYLRWLNRYAAYNYWLFSNSANDQVKTKTLGDINNNWINRISTNSRLHNIGKKVDKNIRCYSRAKKEYMRQIEGLLYSPEVYLYTDNMPLDLSIKNCGWVKVKIKDGSFGISNSENNTQDLRLVIELPEIYVQTLI